VTVLANYQVGLEVDPVGITQQGNRSLIQELMSQAKGAANVTVGGLGRQSSALIYD
jgi:hypothetical protein